MLIAKASARVAWQYPRNFSRLAPVLTLPMKRLPSSPPYRASAGLAAAPSAFGIKAGFNVATQRLEGGVASFRALRAHFRADGC